MGGHNSMITWVSSGYAGSDYIHFSHKGSNIMGDYLSDVFMNLYELYRVRQRMDNDEFNKLWKEIIE